MEKIFVTKPYLPPKEEYMEKISTIWDNHILTNFGPLHREFEDEMMKYLDINNLHYVNNGTTALELAIDSLGDSYGEIITTPFTFVATASAIIWQKYKPVFVDINSSTFNIDPNKIEEKINENTKAIVAVHCFGYPCDIDKINDISQKYNIPVIYDAAHTFGVKYKNNSLLKYGDISICSLHATKVFHSIEGGLCVVNNLLYNDRINATKNFGMQNGSYEYVGINAKSSEFHAAMGLCVLRHISEIISYRKAISNLYRDLLHEDLFVPDIPGNLEYNYIYFPVVFPCEEILNVAVEALNKENIFPKRYFYPCINEFSVYGNLNNTPIASDISKRILCLPLDTYISDTKVKMICEIINKSVSKNSHVYKL